MRPYYLNEKEEKAVQKFIQDETMKNAVRKVLLSGMYHDGVLKEGEVIDPLQNFVLGYFTTQTGQLLSSEEKGNHLNGIIQGVSLLESGFRILDKMKPVPKPVKSPINKAR
jgi:hypothetical protein